MSNFATAVILGCAIILTATAIRNDIKTNGPFWPTTVTADVLPK